MNGRAYDYNLGRFLSVDPFIQAPGNSQSMNPYSYIMNNPLSGTDPSGYIAEASSSTCGGVFDCDYFFNTTQKLNVSLHNGHAQNITATREKPRKPEERKPKNECESRSDRCITSNKYTESLRAQSIASAAAIAQLRKADWGISRTSVSSFLRSSPLVLIVPAIRPTQLGDSSCASGGCGNPLLSHSKDGDKPSGIVVTGGTGSPMPDPDDENNHRGSNKAELTAPQADKILKSKGYRKLSGETSMNSPVYYNPKAKSNLRYMVKSRTSHNGESFKGYRSLTDIKLNKRTGSYDTSLKRVAD